MCRLHNWQSLRLDGSCSVKARQPIVDTFNDPAHPSFVLLLSSKVQLTIFAPSPQPHRAILLLHNAFALVAAGGVGARAT